MIRDGTFPLEEVLPYVVMEKPPHGRSKLQKRPQREYAGRMVYMDSLRLQCFAKSGTHCVSCGLEASFFALERHVNKKKEANPYERFHLNLYGINAESREILFTKDHIVPRSRNGAHHLDNLQTMCSPCNMAKGSDDRVTKVYTQSRNRIKSLRHKIHEEMRAIKTERKQHYQPGTADGGAVFMQYKKRYEQLKTRDQRLQTIDTSLQKRRAKFIKATGKREQNGSVSSDSQSG